MFAGLSTLRTKEKHVEKHSDATKKMQEYLAKYVDGGGAGGDSDGVGKKKRKKKKKPSAGGGGITLLDEDVSGFAPASELPRPSALEDDEEDCERPLILVLLPHLEVAPLSCAPRRSLSLASR